MIITLHQIWPFISTLDDMLRIKSMIPHLKLVHWYLFLLRTIQTSYERVKEVLMELME